MRAKNKITWLVATMGMILLFWSQSAPAAWTSVVITGQAGSGTITITGQLETAHYGANGLTVAMTDGRLIQIPRVTSLHYNAAGLTATYVVDPVYQDGFEGTT